MEFWFFVRAMPSFAIIFLFFFFFFLPKCVPPADTAPILQRQRRLYFEGHPGLWNCFITEMMTWQFLTFRTAGRASSYPIYYNRIH